MKTGRQIIEKYKRQNPDDFQTLDDMIEEALKESWKEGYKCCHSAIQNKLDMISGNFK